MSTPDLAHTAAAINFFLQNPTAFGLYLATVDRIKNENKPYLRSAFNRLAATGWKCTEEFLKEFYAVLPTLTEDTDLSKLSQFSEIWSILTVEEKKALQDSLPALLQ
ncbi:MAG: hypothetical protein HPY50_06840 [Firmicutes bacterium]|nr:hypothetical protein [Bacillota bacterium]